MATETRNLKLVITEKGAKKTQSAVKGINSSLGGVTKSLAGMAVAYVGISKAMAFMSDAVAIHEEYSTQMGIVALNTGESTTATDEFNKKLSVLTGTGITSIATTQAIISSYKGMNATIVKESIPAILDLSAQWGVDAPAAAKQLMKASSDLGSGLLALKKKGLDFTETQIAQMKAMEDAGDKAGVFKAILKQVEKQYKGTAEETANFTDQMKSASDILKESAGGKFLEGMGIEGADLAEQLLNLEPIIDNLAEGLGKLTKFLWDNKEAILAVGSAGLFTKVGNGALTAYVGLKAAARGYTLASTAAAAGVLSVNNLNKALKTSRDATVMWQGYADIASRAWAGHTFDFYSKAADLSTEKTKILGKEVVLAEKSLSKLGKAMNTMGVTSLGGLIGAFAIGAASTAGLILLFTSLKKRVEDVQVANEAFAESFKKAWEDNLEVFNYLSVGFESVMRSIESANWERAVEGFNKFFGTQFESIDALKIEYALLSQGIITDDDAVLAKWLQKKESLEALLKLYEDLSNKYIPDAEVALPLPKVSGIPGDMFTFEDDDFTPDIDVDLFRSDSEMMLLINDHTNQMIADGIDMLDEKKIKAHEDALARAEKEKEIIGDVVRDSLALFNDISTERVSALDREQQAMQETAEYQNATVEDKAAMDKEYNSKKKGILSTQFEVTRLARFAEMGMNTAEAIMEAAPNVPLQIAVGALGAAQGAFIMSQANPYRAALGADFETNGQMLMLVGDNPGGREHVTVTPTSSPNVRGGHGGDLALIEEVRALRVELSTIQRYNIRTIDAVEMSMINEEGGLQRGVI